MRSWRSSNLSPLWTLCAEQEAGTDEDSGGAHAVKEDGKWIRVKESPLASSLPDGGKIRTLGTTTHRLFINGVEFADELETDDFNHVSKVRTISSSEDFISMLFVSGFTIFLFNFP